MNKFVYHLPNEKKAASCVFPVYTPEKAVISSSLSPSFLQPVF
jgi:hypothetical protein